MSSAVATAIFKSCMSFVSNDASGYLQHQSEPSHITDSMVQDERARREGETSGRPQE